MFPKNDKVVSNIILEILENVQNNLLRWFWFHRSMI